MKKQLTHSDVLSLTKNKTQFIFSFDDYSPGNIALAELLHEYGIPATFFIETLTREAHAQIRQLSGMGFAIGGHTVHHPRDMKLLAAEEARSEVEICKRQIEDITGVPCTSFAYPKGRYNEDTIEILKTAGFTHARTVDTCKTAWEDPFRIPTTVHVYSGRKEYQGRPWHVIASFYLDHVLKNGGMFHLFGHADEIARFGERAALRLFLRDKIRPLFI